jgi:hypothetical protein
MPRGIINPRDLAGADAATVAKALGGTCTSQGWLCHCPVIGHGRRRGDIHPSLSVADGNRRLLVYCHAGCDPRDVLDAIRARGLLQPHPERTLKRVPDIPLEQDAARGVQTLWMSATSPDGTVVETYIRRRGILIPIPAAVRVGPGPAMVVAVRDLDRKVIAVQRTLLTSDGLKASVERPRITTGKLGNGAVQLAEPSDVLGLSEGVEDALAAFQETGIPTWAALGAGRMSNVVIPLGVRVLHIFADQDEAGKKAAYATAQDHVGAGRTVFVRFPPNDHKDWGSVVEINNKGRTAA